jgi:carbonic anhydrase
MSCPNATAPIDINESIITGKCKLKCSYNFHYNNSSCVATNRGNYISISYDKSSSPPVLYNAIGYDVQEIRLYTKSLHSYNGSKTDAELIIVHSSNTGASPMLVCIPIKSNNTSSVSSSFFATLVSSVATNAPTEGESTTVIFAKFNLDYLVPRKPFFSYSATEPFQPCTESVEYIVFSSLHASLDMSPDTLATLQTIIEMHPYDIKTGPKLFYNEKGPSMGTAGGDIYIDCQPVGASEETTDIITTTSSSSGDVNEWLNKPAVKLLLGSLLFMAILYLLKMALNMIRPANILKGGASTLMRGGFVKHI